jgi:beta-lactamase class A
MNRTRLTSFLFLSAVIFALLMNSCASSRQAAPQRLDADLQRKLEAVVSGFRGDVGVYVRHLATGQTAAIQPDTLFPTASMVKVPILCAIFDKIEKGELKYSQELLYRDSLKYDDGVTGSFRDSTKKPLAELVMLMITLSDNTASLWLQQLAGTGTTINEWLESNGFHHTRVNSRTPGREAQRKIYQWAQTTPREMATLMATIYQGNAVSRSASEEMFRVLSKPYWDGEAVSQIPPTVHVASKSGAVNASKSEVVLVNAPGGDYVFCVITKNQQDQRWVHDNEGYVLIRNISRLLWTTFGDGRDWKPQPGSEKWAK